MNQDNLDESFRKEKVRKEAIWTSLRVNCRSTKTRVYSNVLWNKVIFVPQEDNVRMEARMESLQDRLSNLQHENLRLQQLLDEAKLSGGKSDSGDKLSATLLAQIKQDQDKVCFSSGYYQCSLF